MAAVFEEKWFLSQIKRNSEDGTYTKGVVVHSSKNDAMNGFHAYFGAYGYDHDKTCDYVACFVSDMSGAIIKSEVDDRIERPTPEPEEG
jgi:hypothetical protein